MSSNNRLGLDTASEIQGLDTIPANTQVGLVMKIRPGNIGIEGLLKRSAGGDAEMLDAEFTVQGGKYDKRKIWSNVILDGTTSGHAKAAEISRALLRAIFEAVHGIDPNDISPATMARRASARLAEFHGATFLATLEIEPGNKRQGGGFYKDKNVIGKVLRVGDPGYRRLDQPPPAPIERSTPPLSQPPTAAASGTPAAAPAGTAIARPVWAKEP